VPMEAAEGSAEAMAREAAVAADYFAMLPGDMMARPAFAESILCKRY
jgi:hypothetical protein